MTEYGKYRYQAAEALPAMQANCDAPTSSAAPAQFHLTASEPCAYLSGQTERKLLARTQNLDKKSIDALHRMGYRRSMGGIYKPACVACQACKSLRVKADDFVASKNQQRILKANKDLELIITPNAVNDDHVALYLDYVLARHTYSDMALMSRNDILEMIEVSDTQSYLFEWRSKKDSALLACCLVDELDDGLSLVYSFFDPRLNKRSLGSFVILSCLDYVQQQNLPFLYLGYWINQASQMRYKSRFKPAQVFEQRAWRDLD